ncbi:right-handed parallel beta-helix repeat-containing protein [bacterium]|nr:right-handed parallel beta-helix repeat-containing protein [bacterium]
MKKNLFFSFVILMLGFITIPLYAKTIDVSNGESIQNAIDNANQGDIIKVAEGDFNEDILIKQGISIEGAGSAKTNLIGLNLIPAVTMEDNTSIKGFHIKSSTSSYNIFVVGSGVNIEKNQINAKFTAIRIESGDAVIYDNQIDSVAFTAIDLESSSAEIRNNLIQSVYIGMYIKNSTVQIIRNLIPGNKNNDNGVYLYNSTGFIMNNIISSHRFPGILAHTNSDVTILNNTIYNNLEHGIACFDSSPIIMNNIIMNDKYGIYTVGNSFPEISFNNLYNNSRGNYITEGEIPFEPSPGDGEISIDPLFVDVDKGNFELTSDSECKNKGNPDGAYNDPDGTANDVGAYGGPETGWIGFYDLPRISISANKTLFSRDDTLTITVRTTNNNPAAANMLKFIVFQSPTAGIFFYPSWGKQIEYKAVNLPSRYDQTETLLSVILKEPLPAGEFYFYAGLATQNIEFPSGISSAYIKIANKPVAKFTVTPKSGKVMLTTFFVDANESSDTETPKALLQFCWQWEDGWGFSDWTTNKKTQHKYPTPGTKTITLQVRDLDNFVDTTTQQIEVTE